jgi:hypothetical protein
MVGIDSTRRASMKLNFIALAMFATLAATSASALPAGSASGLTGAAATLGSVEQVWGGHRSCEWGPVRGWHRHVGIAAIAVPCVPQAAQPFRCWRGYWGVRHCRW